MPTQEAKAHHVGEWASLRNTSPEIAEAIFEVAGYDEKMAEKIWEEGSDEVLVKPLLRPIKIRFFGANRPSNVKTFNQRLPRFSRGVFCYFTASFNTLSNLSIGQKPSASIGQPLNSSVTRCAGACRLTHRHYVTVPHSGTHIQFSSNRDWLCCHANAGKRFCRQSACVRSGHATDTV